MLLNLTVVFDTIDHTILLQHLERSFGVSLNFIDLTASYLTDRMQSVMIGSDSTQKRPFSMATHKDL